jgi:hypothetical protein
MIDIDSYFTGKPLLLCCKYKLAGVVDGIISEEPLFSYTVFQQQHFETRKNTPWAKPRAQ